jgi:hypothetical protein
LGSGACRATSLVLHTFRMHPLQRGPIAGEVRMFDGRIQLDDDLQFLLGLIPAPSFSSIDTATGNE